MKKTRGEIPRCYKILRDPINAIPTRNLRAYKTAKNSTEKNSRCSRKKNDSEIPNRARSRKKEYPSRA